MNVIDDIVDGLTNALAGVRHHRVEFGENVAVISRHYYGNPNHGADIFQANRSVMMNVNDVTPGMVLVIPHLPHACYG